MKIFVKFIRNNIMSICEQKINQNQHGFLPETSCSTQMIPDYDNISLNINDLSSADVMYFVKAFDSANDGIIIHKMTYLHVLYTVRVLINVRINSRAY